MEQPPNPWVTTAEAPGSRRFPQRAFVFFNTPQHIKRGAGEEAGRHQKLHLSVHSLRILQINLLDYEARFELCLFSLPLLQMQYFKENSISRLWSTLSQNKEV